MRCEVGVYTEELHLFVTEDVYAQMKLAMPPRVGHRAWDCTVLAREIRCRRTQFTGVTPSRAPQDHRAGMMRFNFKVETIVRCSPVEAVIEPTSRGSFRVEMPPLHTWPWMRRSQGSEPLERRRRLVQEINARIRSAVEHHEDFPTSVPLWANRMLSHGEWQQIHRNEELR